MSAARDIARRLVTLVALATLAAITAVAARAPAQVPALLPLHGVLRDAGGAPIDGEVQIVFALYDRARGGDALYRETHTLAIEAGRFGVLLGDNTPLDPGLFARHGELFLGVTVEEDDESEPRMRLGSVPFAAAAQLAHEAVTLDGVGLDELQRRVVGSCDNGAAMVAVESDGRVRCVALAASAGPAGPEGPQGLQGPAGPPGPRGPATRFDCAGQAVSALDAEGRATCIPLASVSIRAGSGLAVDGCEGDSCRVSVAPDSIGMAQTDLPMASHVRGDQLLAGVAFYAAGPAFVPDSDGHCLIVATLDINDPASSVTRGRVDSRASYLVDGELPPELPSVGSYPALTPEGGAVASTTSHAVIPVARGRSYLFGCNVGVDGEWVGKAMWCQVSRFCQ